MRFEILVGLNVCYVVHDGSVGACAPAAGLARGLRLQEILGLEDARARLAPELGTPGLGR